MLLNPGKDAGQVEDCAGLRADGMFERLEREGAESERKSPEGGFTDAASSFPDSSAGAG
jgi:hypothetical protein